MNTPLDMTEAEFAYAQALVDVLLDQPAPEEREDDVDPLTY